MLDTNVVSAVTGRQPSMSVVRWLDRVPPVDLAITSINLFELRFGIELLNDALPQQRLTARLDWFLATFIRGRVLPLDAESANATAILAGRLRRAGKPVGLEDTMIAGICLAHGATLATRNVRHFADAGLTLINPWDEGDITATVP